MVFQDNLLYRGVGVLWKKKRSTCTLY